MCGIAGIATVGGERLQKEVASLKAMLSLLERRGPDSGGIVELDTAVLGHRRLAIFDPSPAGHQPMSTPDGRVSISFNGAIYNFKELRRELEIAGVTFRSQTDTEVLLHGYRVWGIDTLVERSRGMFAFAIWDDECKSLFLARDRLGVKPLVYTTRNDMIAFASTLRALRASGLLGELEPRAVAEFLEHGFVPADTTIYAGACKLPAASIAEWNNGTLTVRQYWNPPEALPAGTIKFADAVGRTEELLTEAVRQRLFADVPVGTLLSGGIDSALVCWAAASLGARVTAFTVATPGQATDESADALATAREIGIDVQIFPMSDTDTLDINELTDAYSEPFATQSALGMLRVSSAIRAAGIKVVLTGDGGDDVFLGYARHRHMRAVERAARFVPPGAGGAWRLVRGLVPPVGPLRRARHFVDYLTGGLGSYLRARDGLPGWRDRGLLGPRLTNQTPSTREVRPCASGRSLLTNYLRHQLRHQFQGEYLMKVDGATMYHGLEARSPFFDQSLWESAASLPYDVRLRNGETKAVLRAIARQRISPRLASGRKRGFSIPVEQWLRGRWKSEIRERLTDSQLCRDGWISRSGLDRALAEANGGGPGAHHLWYTLVLEEWLRAERDMRGREPIPHSELSRLDQVGARSGTGHELSSLIGKL